ncbi:hypothetical protein JNB71_10875 [Rhizobium herbae]|uniref:Uncharacterized protein n=1 Tax=Rhizobium herbae TaxID=508661 RepID=A0ABS7HBN7_9HYPH|nr:hypothetical protein [Rhizobium herbae]MBW9063824.1 hypothetical protein [Rhizobium herbae]
MFLGEYADVPMVEFKVAGKLYAFAPRFRTVADEKLIRPANYRPGVRTYSVARLHDRHDLMFDFPVDENRTAEEIRDMAYINVCNALGIDAGTAEIDSGR